MVHKKFCKHELEFGKKLKQHNRIINNQMSAMNSRKVMFMKCYVGIDSIGCNAKNNNVGQIKNRIRLNYNFFKIEEIIKLVGEQGHSIIPAAFKEDMKRNSFEKQQIFMLTFSNKTSDTRTMLAEVLKKANDYLIDVAYVYENYNSTSDGLNNGLTIAFVFEFEITDRGVAKFIYKILMKLFPEADAVSGDVTNMFYGGIKLLYSNPKARVEPVKLLNVMKPMLNGTNRKRDTIRLLKGTGIAEVNGRIAFDYLENRSMYGLAKDSKDIIIIGKTKNSSIFFVRYVSEGQSRGNQEDMKKKMQSQNIRINPYEHSGICSLLDDFIYGKEQLDNDELFLLATNFNQFINGEAMFLDVFKKYNNLYGMASSNYWRKKFATYIRGYAAKDCCRICRHYVECNKNVSTINMAHEVTKGRRIVVENKSYVDDPDYVYELLHRCFLSVLSCNNRGLHLIKGPTGIGKTSLICQICKEFPNLKVLVAEPLCSMKSEFYKKINETIPGVDVYIHKTVMESESISEELRDEYQRLHNSGKHKKAQQLIEEELERVKNLPETNKTGKELSIIRLKEIINSSKELARHRITIVTQKKLILMSEEQIANYDIVIIDEDILYLTLVKDTKRISKSKVEQIAGLGKGLYPVRCRGMLRARLGEVKKVEDFNNSSWPDWEEFYGKKHVFTEEEDTDDYDYIESDEDNNITDMKWMGSYVLGKDGYFQYLCVHRLPPAKYVVLSATYNEEFYRAYFDKMEVFTYPECNVRYKGKLIQNVSHCLGRGTLNNHQELFDYVKTVTGINKIISFKGQRKAINNINPQNNLHFGNAVGVNCLENSDFVIIGTPYMCQAAN